MPAATLPPAVLPSPVPRRAVLPQADRPPAVPPQVGPRASRALRAAGREGPRETNGRAAHESRLYADLSHVYDTLFGRVFLPRISRVIRGLRIAPGTRVLELGVGTGLSLGAYPAHCAVVGLDRSAAMLRVALEKVRRSAWDHVRMVEGDAQALPFPDDAFDYVMAFHVVTVVPDAHCLMREAIRVLRPGGRLVVVNRFRSREAWLDRLERRMEPLWRRWGWTTLRREDLFRPHPLRILAARRDGPYRLFTAVVARNQKSARRAASLGHEEAEA